MTSGGTQSLTDLLEQWPIVASLAAQLPAGDLIALSRTSSDLRAVLHGLRRSTRLEPLPGQVRDTLCIGSHQTLYWKKLKDHSTFLCSSKTHTKGQKVRPCRYCSMPICEACIVRSSFGKRKENTLQNRIRCLCTTCYDTQRPHKAYRYPASPNPPRNRYKLWYPGSQLEELCTCTLKSDGWLCVECKDWQNADAASDSVKICYGKGCSTELGSKRVSRRICLWCGRCLPRPVGGEQRRTWNQKIVEIRAMNAASRSADVEEYHRKRLRSLRMSRRELRGDNAVEYDAHADEPRYLRHLDAVNYRRWLIERVVPDGSSIYASKQGRWGYKRDFLLEFRERVPAVYIQPDVQAITQQGAFRFARTNAEKSRTEVLLESAENDDEWNTFMPIILELHDVQRCDFQTLALSMAENCDFRVTPKDYENTISIWHAAGWPRRHKLGLDENIQYDCAEDLFHASMYTSPRKVLAPGFEVERVPGTPQQNWEELAHPTVERGVSILDFEAVSSAEHEECSTSTSCDFDTMRGSFVYDPERSQNLLPPALTIPPVPADVGGGRMDTDMQIALAMSSPTEPEYIANPTASSFSTSAAAATSLMRSEEEPPPYSV